MTSDTIYKPTWLYIKQHKLTGLLYFGKTTRKHIDNYPGSGLHWKRHIKKHGIDLIDTLWYCLFLDKETLVNFAVNFSIQQNIVKSTDWANLKTENGLDGGSEPGVTKRRPKRPPFVGPKRPRNWNTPKKDKALVSKKFSDQRRGTTTYTNGVETIRLHTSDPRIISGEYYSPKKKPKETRQYSCIHCGKIFEKLEFIHHPVNVKPVCSYNCSNALQYVNNTRKSMKGTKLKFKRKLITLEDGSRKFIHKIPYKANGSTITGVPSFLNIKLPSWVSQP